METTAGKQKLAQELLRLVTGLLDASISREMTEEESLKLKQIIALADDLSCSLKRQKGETNRGRKKKQKNYELIVTPERIGQMYQILWGAQKIGCVSELYPDGTIKIATNQDEVMKELAERIFGSSANNPSQHVGEAFNRDKALKPFKDMYDAAVERKYAEKSKAEREKVKKELNED